MSYAKLCDYLMRKPTEEERDEQRRRELANRWIACADTLSELMASGLIDKDMKVFDVLVAIRQVEPMLSEAMQKCGKNARDPGYAACPRPKGHYGPCSHVSISEGQVLP